MENIKILLASCSPRRRELISLLRTDFICAPVSVDERLAPGASPQDAVVSISAQKALSAKGLSEAEGRFIVSADTVVTLDGAIFGKPHDDGQAFEMLKALSGREHEVCTGVCVIAPSGVSMSFCERSFVEFYSLDDAEILDYIATGEPSDKAGAYGIQGYGALLVKGLRGDYYNVMGLPVAQLARVLKRCAKFETQTRES